MDVTSIASAEVSQPPASPGEPPAGWQSLFGSQIVAPATDRYVNLDLVFEGEEKYRRPPDVMPTFSSGLPTIRDVGRTLQLPQKPQHPPGARRRPLLSSVLVAVPVPPSKRLPKRPPPPRRRWDCSSACARPEEMLGGLPPPPSLLTAERNMPAVTSVHSTPRSTAASEVQHQAPWDSGQIPRRASFSIGSDPEPWKAGHPSVGVPIVKTPRFWSRPVVSSARRRGTAQYRRPDVPKQPVRPNAEAVARAGEVLTPKPPPSVLPDTAPRKGAQRMSERRMRAKKTESAADAELVLKLPPVVGARPASVASSRSS